MSKSPRGGTSVMAHRLGQEADHPLPDADQWRKLDLFPTPPWGTRELFKHVMPALQLPPRIRTVWEPAAVFGHMSVPLSEFSQMTLATDIYPYGPHLDAQIDFTKADPNTALVDWVITNPPFDHAYEFLEQAMRIARRGVAFLVRLAWLESQGRITAYGRRPHLLLSPFSLNGFPCALEVGIRNSLLLRPTPGTSGREMTRASGHEYSASRSSSRRSSFRLVAEKALR
jgi:hypothetical protein